MNFFYDYKSTWVRGWYDICDVLHVYLFWWCLIGVDKHDLWTYWVKFCAHLYIFTCWINCISSYWVDCENYIFIPYIYIHEIMVPLWNTGFEKKWDTFMKTLFVNMGRRGDMSWVWDWDIVYGLRIPHGSYFVATISMSVYRKSMMTFIIIPVHKALHRFGYASWLFFLVFLSCA